MGNAKAASVVSAREKARAVLAAEAADAEARQRRIAAAGDSVWSAAEAQMRRQDRRDVAVDKLQRTFEAGRAKAHASYDADLAQVHARRDDALRRLLAEGKSAREVADLADLPIADIRALKTTIDASDAPAANDDTGGRAVEQSAVA